MALADGTVAKSGGTVIKNVAGYDIAKLMAGSFGTLGLLLSVNVRLHPRPGADRHGRRPAPTTADAANGGAGAGGGAGRAGGAGRRLARKARPAAGAGRAGPRSEPRGVRLADELRRAGLTDVEALIDGGSELWDAQRAAQRSSTHATVKVAARASELAALLAAVEGCGGSLVGRAALGHSWVTLEPASIARLRSELPAGATATVQDLPGERHTRRPVGADAAGAAGPDAAAEAAL